MNKTNTSNQSVATKVRRTNPNEVPLTPALEEALRHVAISDGSNMEFMNVAEVQPLVRLFERMEKRSTREYFDTRQGRTTRLVYCIGGGEYRRLHVAWTKHRGDLARQLTLRLPAEVL